MINEKEILLALLLEKYGNTNTPIIEKNLAPIRVKRKYSTRKTTHRRMRYNPHNAKFYMVPWTAEEDARLHSMVLQNATIKVMAEALERSPGAVKIRVAQTIFPDGLPGELDLSNHRNLMRRVSK